MKTLILIAISIFSQSLICAQNLTNDIQTVSLKTKNLITYVSENYPDNSQDIMVFVDIE